MSRAGTAVVKNAFSVYFWFIYPCFLMRVIIVDDHLIFGQSLGALLAGLENLEIVAILGSGNEALRVLEKEKVDLVISDLQMPQLGGVELTLKIRLRFPEVKIMVLSMIQDADMIREALRAGVVGFGSKSIDKSELFSALNIIEKGEIYLSPLIIHELSRAPAIRHNEVMPDMGMLSEREIEVLKLIAQELNTGEIAEALFVSVNTVETHRKNLMKKLGAKNAIGLIKFALRFGLID